MVVGPPTSSLITHSPDPHIQEWATLLSSEHFSGTSDHILQYNGFMDNGQPEGMGDLMYESRTLYTGIWSRGCCAQVGTVLPGVKGFSLRQLYSYYLHRCSFSCRMNPDFHNVLQIRVLDIDTGNYSNVEVDPDYTMTKTRSKHGISGHVLRLVRRPETGDEWVEFTAGCGCQEFTKLVQMEDKDTGLERVVSCIGPRETWYESDQYEYVVYSTCNNHYSMFQPLLQPEHMVGLEFIGNNTPHNRDIPVWVGLFSSRDAKYKLQEGVKFQIDDEFVRNYFSRYIRTAMRNPNKTLDLLSIAADDRGSSGHKIVVEPWHLSPANARVKPGFRWWTDRPEDLVNVVQGCVKNMYELMYIPGGRWRFVGRFNHRLTHISSMWYQLDEFWMEKYLKPQCLHDMCYTVTPFTKVKVHKTGHRDGSAVKECVKQVILPLIPPDDDRVLAAVLAWPDEVDFTSKVGQLSQLSAISRLYDYNARRVKYDVLSTMFANEVWDRDVNIVLRPTDEIGEPLLFQLNYLHVLTHDCFLFQAGNFTRTCYKTVLRA